MLTDLVRLVNDKSMQELYIETHEALVDVCHQLKQSDWFALDTEFIREKTYYAILCLVQVANDELVACIDPLALKDLGPLTDLLYDESITKVIHSASQDLGLFYDNYDKVPKPVFDTQIAATLLGLGHQVSYGAMVNSMLGVQLDKAHGRTDWKKRPLSPEQLHYARDDARYLARMYPGVLQALNKASRSDWITTDLDKLVSEDTYRIELETVWKRVNGSSKLKGVQLACLQGLASWREQRARNIDRPRRWVISDDALTSMARQMPDTIEALHRIPGLHDKMIQRDGKALLECIDSARQLPKEQWPQVKRSLRLTDEQEATADALMATVRLRCAENDISPAIVATRKELTRLASGDRDVEVLKGWRRELVGNDLLELLEGRTGLQVTQGTLTLEPTPKK